MLCLVLLPETLPNYTIDYKWNDNFVKTLLLKLVFFFLGLPLLCLGIFT